MLIYKLILKFKFGMACCSSSYKDVNIDAQFLPVHIKINGKEFSILDSNGYYIKGIFNSSLSNLFW